MDWHNPKNAASPGDGWRFLTKQEIKEGPMAHSRLAYHVEMWNEYDQKWGMRLSPSDKPFSGHQTYRVRVAQAPLPLEHPAPRPSKWPRWDALIAKEVTNR